LTCGERLSRLIASCAVSSICRTAAHGVGSSRSALPSFLKRSVTPYVRDVGYATSIETGQRLPRWGCEEGHGGAESRRHPILGWSQVKPPEWGERNRHSQPAAHTAGGPGRDRGAVRPLTGTALLSHPRPPSIARGIPPASGARLLAGAAECSFGRAMDSPPPDHWGARNGGNARFVQAEGQSRSMSRGLGGARVACGRACTEPAGGAGAVAAAASCARSWEDHHGSGGRGGAGRVITPTARLPQPGYPF